MRERTFPAPVNDTTAARRPFRTLPGDHRFFSMMSIVASLTILAGFANTYGPKLVTGAPELPPIIHLHAAVFTTWLVLFVAQTTLVLAHRTDVHRRLGVAGVLLAALMLVVGVAASVIVTRHGHRGIPGVEFQDPGGFLLLNLMTIGVFAVLVAAGWYRRRDIHAHKRLMLMATAGALVGPGVSRLPFASGRPPVIALLALTFLFAGPVYDLVTRRRIHPVYLWSSLLALAAGPPAVQELAATAAWRQVAAWLLH
jgi:FtsH-binding integral membrane protein